MSEVETLRQAALAKVRHEEFDEALSLYDEAVAAATDEETIELLTINKADTLIAIERGGPEVQQLPMILMRRRNHHHTFLAAYALMYKHRLQNEFKRAQFYGQVALDAATEAGEPLWKLGALNELGVIYEIDSQFTRAIECFEEAVALTRTVENETDRSLSTTATVGNLGYNKLLVGKIDDGIRLILSIIDQIEVASSLAEAHVDLCFGYLELADYDRARFHGEKGLQLANEERVIRNAHYLLGETAYKSGDTEKAGFHFDELARYYPQFQNLKSLLFAIDLRSMVNFRR